MATPAAEVIRSPSPAPDYSFILPRARRASQTFHGPFLSGRRSSYLILEKLYRKAHPREPSPGEHHPRDPEPRRHRSAAPPPLEPITENLDPRHLTPLKKTPSSNTFPSETSPSREERPRSPGRPPGAVCLALTSDFDIESGRVWPVRSLGGTVLSIGFCSLATGFCDKKKEKGKKYI